MDDGHTKPNFIDPKLAPHGVAMGPYHQKNGGKDLVVTIDVGEPDASNCRFLQVDSFAVVAKGSAPPSCIFRIQQWVRRKDFEGWQTVYDNGRTTEENCKERRLLKESRNGASRQFGRLRSLISLAKIILQTLPLTGYASSEE